MGQLSSSHLAGESAARRRVRILIPEASSLAARQAITVLGLRGHELEVCDPEPVCIGRFSRFVRCFHRCPGLGVDPEGFLALILDLVFRERFDVLLPTHEQAFLFSKVRGRLLPYVAVALPSFERGLHCHHPDWAVSVID
jgi:hypothetical protein